MTMNFHSTKMLLACFLLAAALGCSHKSPSPGNSAEPAHEEKPHSVTLRWDAPSGIATGYNVYRSTTSGKDFVKIASMLPSPRYEDSQVTTGATYFYVVTSVNPGGHESRFSGEVRATIP
jgi:fibronectin type 3 domain-containing protein